MVVLILIMIVSTPLTYLLTGVTLKLLWGWFMVTALGLPAISLALATVIGIIGGLVGLVGWTILNGWNSKESN